MKRTFNLSVLFPIFVVLLCANTFDVHAQTTESLAGSGAWLGVRIGDVYASSERQGVFVEAVVENGPADKAGLKHSDVIIALDDENINDNEELLQLLRQRKSGDTVVITVLREGVQHSFNVQLGERSRERKVISKNIRIPRPRVSSMPARTRGVYGMSIMTLNEQLARHFGAPDGKGVLVTHVDETGDAAKAGFRAGDVIVRAGKKTVVDAGDLRNVLAAHDTGEKIPVRIIRDGKQMTLEITAKERDSLSRSDRDWNLPRTFRLFQSESQDSVSDGVGDLRLDLHLNLDSLFENGIRLYEHGIRKMRLFLDDKEIELNELHEEILDDHDDGHELIDQRRKRLEDARKSLKDTREKLDTRLNSIRYRFRTI